MTPTTDRRAASTAALAVLVGAVSLLVCAAGASGQFSPGKLSSEHAELEGSSHCLDCHSAGQGVSPERCLSCHVPLRKRIEAGLGVHAGTDYERCETCHMEHSGEAFELVFWGDEGIEGFDHQATGYNLEGAHREVACRDCHRGSNIASPQPLLAVGKDLDRTCLGLETSCLSCHDDRHRGEFSTERCLDCHTIEAWQPASGFDHQQTAFPLTGLHQPVACADCHVKAEAPAGAATSIGSGPGDNVADLQFQNLSHDRCTDCHSDPHDQRLGSLCESCHTTNGWLGDRARSEFDHEQTRYPLRGRHQAVACTDCHPAGRAASRVRYAACTDCHQDRHATQFAHRDDQGACDSCHTVAGFAPADFSLAAHQETAFSLAGAHLAVACDQCHLPVSLRRLSQERLIPATAARGRGFEITRFRFPAAACQDCHDDAHEAEPEPITDDGCDSCHSVSSWLDVTIEHDETRFPLTGKHREVGCDSCHRIETAIGADRVLRLTGLGTACIDCHDDTHAGQLAAADGAPRCTGCHQTSSWQEHLFEHDRDSRFKLAGGHLGVACVACHAVESHRGRGVTRYKPTPTACEDCHR